MKTKMISAAIICCTSLLGLAQGAELKGGIAPISPGNSAEFCGVSALPSGWEFQQVLPLASPNHLTANSSSLNGFQILLNAKNAFGFLETIDSSATAIPSPGTGKIMRVVFSASSNQASAYGNETIRIRIGARDGSFTQTHTFQEGSPSNSAPVVSPVSSNLFPRNFEAVYFAPASISNNLPATSNGVVFAFDVLQFGDTGTSGAVGAQLSIQRAMYDILNPADFLPGTEILNLNFVGNTHGFTPIDFKPDNSSVTGIYPADLDSVLGLAIHPTRSPTTDTTKASGIRFSFGIWEKQMTVASGEPWIVQSGKIYKVVYTLASNADLANQSHTARMRFTVGDNDFIGDATITPTQDQTIDPRGGGTTYTAYVKFPDSTAGLPVTIAFDVFKVNSTSTGTMILRNLAVTSYTSWSVNPDGASCNPK